MHGPATCPRVVGRNGDEPVYLACHGAVAVFLEADVAEDVIVHLRPFGAIPRIAPMRSFRLHSASFYQSRRMVRAVELPASSARLAQISAMAISLSVVGGPDCLWVCA